MIRLDKKLRFHLERMINGSNHFGCFDSIHSRRGNPACIACAFAARIDPADFVEHVLGSTTPLTAGDQKTTFQVIVSDTLGEDSDYEVVRNIHDNLNEMIEQSKEEPEPLELSKTDVRKLLTRSGVAEEKLESFDDEFDETVGIHGTLLASNIASAKTFQIETPDVVVKVNPERADLVETRDIDGRRCLVIAIDDHLEVNGIEIH